MSRNPQTKAVHAPDGGVPIALAPPAGNDRFVELDGVRALAVLSVVWFHAALDSHVTGGRWWAHWIGGLTFAPQLFFMLSGFLLYRPFVVGRVHGRPVRARQFWRKRVLRIFPGLWVALTLAAIYPGAPGVFSSDWWKYYGLLHVYFADSVFGGLAITWTLCTEVAFYVVLPLAAMAAALTWARLGAGAARRSELLALLVLAGLSILWQHHLASQPILSAVQLSRVQTLPGETVFFAVGMALAILTVPLGSDPSPRDRLGRAWRPFWIGCFVAAGAVYLYKVTTTHLPFWVSMLNGLVALLIFIPSALARGDDGGVMRVLRSRAGVWIATVSYGTYLYHRSVIMILIRIGLGGNDLASYLVLTVIATLISLAVGFVSYVVVEQYFLRLKGRRPRSGASTTATESPRIAR